MGNRFVKRSQGLGPRRLMNCCECHKIYARDHKSLFMSAMKEKKGQYFAQIYPNFTRNCIDFNPPGWLPQSKSQILFHGCGFC